MVERKSVKPRVGAHEIELVNYLVATPGSAG